MAVAITATLYGGQTPQAVLVTVTGLSAADSVNVWREPPSSARRIVRGGLDLDDPPDTLLLVDVEPELGRPLVYVAEYWPTGVAVPVEVSAAPVTVPDLPGGRHHVLSDPYSGDAVLVDVLYDDDERVQPARVSILQAQGQAYPVAITDVRTVDNGNLSAFTRDRTETLQLVELLADGRPIVSRHSNDGCDIPAGEVLVILDAGRSRRTRDGDRRWSLPFQVIDTPDPTLQLTLTTLQDLADLYTGLTLTDLAGDYATLLQLAQDDLGVV
jgi:hypothetical protein